MKLSLAISHTPWVPERVASMGRLYSLLGSQPVHVFNSKEEVAGHTAPPGFDHFAVFAEKAANHVWSDAMWHWAAGVEADWCVFLQDDAIVEEVNLKSGDNFASRFEALLVRHEVQDGIIGLQVAHPAAVPLEEEGIRGFTTADGLVGVGYAIRQDVLRMFLAWRERLKPGALEAITEDTLIGLFALYTGRKIFHPIPTLVDHDTILLSTFGNDNHANRNSRVRWDSPRTDVAHSKRIPHLGRFYHATPQLLNTWVKDVTTQDLRRVVGDNGHRELQRLNFARRAKGAEAKARLFIATPVRGEVNVHYANSLLLLCQDESTDVELSLQIVNIQQRHEDVVRVRSRLVTYFLTQTDATHLLFLDSDVELLPKVVRGMLAAGKDFVAAPYPKREAVNWKAVQENPDLPAEAVAYKYSVNALEELRVEPDNTAEVEGVGLGCALLSRKGLEDMVERHPELIFDDGPWGVSCALFQLIINRKGLLSEDFSFCQRWREAGKKVWIYLGEGSPINHYGEHRYGGNIEAFGLKRVAR